MLWSEANKHIVGGLQPIGMPPLKNGVNQLFSHSCSLMAFNFVSQRVERTGQCMPSVIVLSFALQILSILTLTTAAYSKLVKVTPTIFLLVLIAGVPGQCPNFSCKLFGKLAIRQNQRKVISCLFDERLGEATASLFVP